MDDIEMNDFDVPGEDFPAQDEEETAIDDPLEDPWDDLWDDLWDTNRQDVLPNDAIDDRFEEFDFRRDNEDDRYRRRKEQTDRLRELSLNNIKADYVGKLEGSAYRIRPSDGKNSGELFRRLGVKKNWLTLDGVGIAYISTGGKYTESRALNSIIPLQEYRKLYESALEEHKDTVEGMVEEVIGGETSTSTVRDITTDATDQFHRETDIEQQTLRYDVEVRDGADAVDISQQDLRELVGTTNPQGETPQERIAALRVQKAYYEEELSKENTPERKALLETGRRVAEQGIDSELIGLGQRPESEEGKQRYGEIVEEDVRTRFERLKKWAKDNLGSLSAVAISIGGIITTVVLAGKNAIVGAAKGVGAVGKALARLAKNALPILVPVLNMLATVLGWGARGLAFLARNLWLVAVVLTGVVYRYMRGRWSAVRQSKETRT